MKKIILMAAVAVMTAVSASAQDFSKKDWFLDANLSSFGLAHAFQDGESATALSLNVGGGYFLSDKFALEAGLGTAIVEDANAFSFGLGARYYPYKNLFASLGYSGMKVEDFDIESNLALTVGYDLFISDKVFFEPAVFYQKNINKKSDGGGLNTIGLSVGIGVKF
jgi:opacity protein-like surface antigen